MWIMFMGLAVRAPRKSYVPPSAMWGALRKRSTGGLLLLLFFDDFDDFTWVIVVSDERRSGSASGTKSSESRTESGVLAQGDESARGLRGLARGERRDVDGLIPTPMPAIDPCRA